jgi:beta-N-acetylhexosaminidase
VSAPGNPPIGALHRGYGAAPAAPVATVVRSAAAGGVLATLKHFPGLGRVPANPDTSAQVIDSWTTVDGPYLAPFAAGIRAGAAAVMVSSARYPRLDPGALAVFSAPVITGLLRRRLGFTGLVLSDDLGAAAAVRAVSPGDRAVRFIGAGGDMVLTVRATDAGPMARALARTARAVPAFADRVDAAAAMVLSSKYRAGLLSCPPTTPGSMR